MKFNVRGIPTLILFKNGQAEGQKIGARPQGGRRQRSWTASCERLPRQPGTEPARQKRGGGGGGPDGNRGPRQDELPPDEFIDGDDLDVISPAELEASRQSMNLTRAEGTSRAPDLLKVAQQMGLENLARSRKQDIIFAILQGARAQRRGHLRRRRARDPAGRLRLPALAPRAPTSPARTTSTSVPRQIRRFNLRTGDTISGLIRPPKDGERYFALLKVGEINFDSPENARSKVLFENLTPLHPTRRLKLERGTGSTEDLTARMIDLIAPLGKGQRGLIVSPPKAGKTMLLQNIANSITGEPSRGLPDRAAHRRAARGSDRDDAHRARRGRLLDVRRAGEPPRAGRRDGDREGQAPGRAQEATS